MRRDPVATREPTTRWRNCVAVLALALLAVGAFGTMALAGGRQTIVRYNDGGIAARFVELPDGGAMEFRPGGGRRIVPTRNCECTVDAGRLEALLRRRSCRASGDCAVFQPEVDATNIKCCYAIELAVA